MMHLISNKHWWAIVALGPLSIIPAGCLAYILGVHFGGLYGTTRQSMLTVVYTGMGLTALLSVVFGIHIYLSDLTKERKVALAHVLIWGSLFAFPWFWYRFYVKGPATPA